MNTMMSRRARLMTGVGFGLALMAAAGGAAAQSAPQDASTQIDDVIVTTERREQSLQDVAATVQTFTGEELSKLGVNSDFRNLQYVVPGLQVTNQEGKLEVFLRGIGSTDSDFSSDPSVATHFNGVYLARPRGIGPLFFDAARVEVNKGPQGTLRGRNATGGTINIISNRPEFGDLYGHVQVGVGNFSDRQAEAVLNLPVTDTLALRGSVWTREHDGLYTNAFPVSSDFMTPSSQDDIAGRLQLRWEPTEALSVNLLYSKAEVRSSGDPGAFSGRALSAGYDIDDLNDPWNQYFRREGRYDGDLDTFLAVVSYDLGGIGVEYNGSYNSVNAYNANASREWQLGQVYPGSAAEAAQVDLTWNDTFYQAEDSETTGHELRFFSQTDGPFQWTAGAFLSKEEYSYLSWDVGNGYCGDSDWFEAGTVSCWQNGLGGENRGDGSTVESLAFYADGTYAVADNFRIKAGIRQTRDEKVARESNAQYQFVFDKTFLASYGYNEFSDITIGSQGFRLTAPGQRSLQDPVVCGEVYDLAGLQGAGVCEGGAFNRSTQGRANLDYFFAGVEQFGLTDTWDDFFKACQAANACYAVIRSDLRPDGVQANSTKDDYINWRLGAEYDLNPDQMLYATVSTGTRSGGINRPVTLGDGSALNSTWRPEELTAYEFGSKNMLDVGGYRMRLNGAVFYYDYSDKVVQNLVDVPIFVPGNPGATTQQVVSDNAAAATVLGAELEGDVGLDAGFNVGWAVTWLDSEFKETSLLDPRSSVRGVNVEGNRLPNTSEWNVNLRVSQEIALNWQGFNSFDWTVNLLYRSDYYLSPFNNKGYAVTGGVSREIPLSQMPAPSNNGRLSGVGGPANPNFYRDDVDGFVIVNLNAGLNFGETDQYRLDAYVENATNQAFSGKGFINNSVNIRYLNAPRMYGFRLKAAF